MKLRVMLNATLNEEMLAMDIEEVVDSKNATYSLDGEILTVGDELGHSHIFYISEYINIKIEE